MGKGKRRGSTSSGYAEVGVQTQWDQTYCSWIWEPGMASDTLCDLGKGSSLFCLVKSANLNRLGRAILFQDAFLPAGEEVLGLWQLETLGGGALPCFFRSYGYGHPAP